MNQIRIIVTSEPVAKGRPRVTTVNGRPRTYTPKKTASWENDCRQLARIEMGSRKPLQGPVRVEVIAVFTPPASWPAWKRDAALSGALLHTGKPDASNLAKAAEDALNGVVWGDDAQVVELVVRKSYGERAMVEILVKSLPASPSQITRKTDLGA